MINKWKGSSCSCWTLNKPDACHLSDTPCQCDLHTWLAILVLGQVAECDEVSTLCSQSPSCGPCSSLILTTHLHDLRLQDRDVPGEDNVLINWASVDDWDDSRELAHFPPNVPEIRVSKHRHIVHRWVPYNLHILP